MPTVRGLIQEIQHNGLLHKAKLNLLVGTALGIDAAHFFENLYTPPQSYELLGVVDYEGLDAVVQTQLQHFQDYNIRPIFVLTGLSQTDRVHTLEQQHQMILEQQQKFAEQQKAAEQQAAQQQDQQFDDIMGGFSMYRTSSNKKAKKNNKMLTAAAQQTPQHPQMSIELPKATLEEINWRFDDDSLAARQHGWDNVQSKQYESASENFEKMTTTFSPQYRKALCQILCKYQASQQYGKVSILHAPYTVSAQLAWLQRMFFPTSPFLFQSEQTKVLYFPSWS